MNLTLKLDLNYKNNLDKNLVRNKYSICFVTLQSFWLWVFTCKDCMPTSERCWKKNSGAQWTRTSNLVNSVQTPSQLSYIGCFVERDDIWHIVCSHLLARAHIYWAPKETIHSIYLKLFYSKNETLTFVVRNVIVGV